MYLAPYCSMVLKMHLLPGAISIRFSMRTIIYSKYIQIGYCYCTTTFCVVTYPCVLSVKRYVPAGSADTSIDWLRVGVGAM